MDTRKPKPETRRPPWSLLVLLLFLLGFAVIAFGTPTSNSVDCSDEAGKTPDCPAKEVDLAATMTRDAEAVILTRAVHTPVAVVVTATSVPPTATQLIPSARLTPHVSQIVMASRMIALPQCELKTMLDETHNPSQSADTQIQALVDRLNAYYAEQGGADTTVALESTLTGPAVFWMQIDGAVTDRSVVRLRSSATWGVFYLEAGDKFVTTGEGGSLALTSEKRCPLRSEDEEA